MTITILDGGISRELQALGAPFRQPEWSALALIETPDLVAAAHENFAAAGAQVISTNSYAVVPFHIGHDRFALGGVALAQRAGKLARGVADRYGAKVAGSLPPPLGSYRPDLFDALAAELILAPLIEGLAPFVDIWLAETQSSLAEAAVITRLLAGDNRPLWLSFTLDDVHDETGAARLRSSESITDAAHLAATDGASALLFNCSFPEVMDAAVREAKIALTGTEVAIGVYANGFFGASAGEGANEKINAIRTDLDPAHYLDFARQWQASGATLIGGCCGIGPAHIAALATAFGRQ